MYYAISGSSRDMLLRLGQRGLKAKEAEDDSENMEIIILNSENIKKSYTCTTVEPRYKEVGYNKTLL